MWAEGCNWWWTPPWGLSSEQPDGKNEANLSPNPKGNGTGFVSSTWAREECLEWANAYSLKRKIWYSHWSAHFSSSLLGPHKPPRFLKPQMLLRLSPHHCYQGHIPGEQSCWPRYSSPKMNSFPDFWEACILDHVTVSFCEPLSCSLHDIEGKGQSATQPMCWKNKEAISFYCSHTWSSRPTLARTIPDSGLGSRKHSSYPPPSAQRADRQRQ